MSNNQTIQQMLPPVSDNRIIMVELIKESGASNFKAVFSPNGTDSINGASTAITLSEDGFAGMFIPVLNESGWDWIPYSKITPSYLGASDDNGDIIMDVKDMHFKAPLFIEHNDDTNQTNINLGDVKIIFEDSTLNKTFKAPIIQSFDKSVRIAMIPDGQDSEGNDQFKADLSVASTAEDEGVAMVLEYNQSLNFAFPDVQPAFSNILYSGGSAVSYNENTGGIITQEIDQKDPNITEGTTFVSLLDYVPNKEEDNTLSQDGSIILALVDKDGNYIIDINGKPAVIQRDYKSGESALEMHLATVFKMKSYTEVFYKLIGTFEQEEVISVGIGSGICVQAINEQGGTGKALDLYENYTDNHIQLGKTLYSTNNINFARSLVKDTVTTILGPDTEYLGDNLTFDARTSVFQQIINNGFNIKSNDSTCIFSIYKKYSSVDLFRLSGRDIDVSVSIKNKNDAFRVDMLGYDGILPITEPNLLSFVNDQPQYNPGWNIIDSMFISENALSDKRRVAKTFTFPDAQNYKECAFVLRPITEQTPVDVIIYDFEGDIKPDLNYVLIKERFYPGQKALIDNKAFTKSAIMCPLKDLSLRFTINSTDTKIPVGIFKTNHFVKNNNAWYDAGSAEKDVQGDMLILESFKGNISYSLNLFNEQNTDNAVEVWLAKVEKDGSFTKIQDSLLQTTVKANTLPSLKNNEVVKPSFIHNFIKGESYRLFAKTTNDDGAFIQVDNGSHVPMVEIIVEAKYFTEIPEDIIHLNGLKKITFVEDGKELANQDEYKLQYDIKTNTFNAIKIK